MKSLSWLEQQVSILDGITNEVTTCKCILAGTTSLYLGWNNKKSLSWQEQQVSILDGIISHYLGWKNLGRKLGIKLD